MILQLRASSNVSFRDKRASNRQYKPFQIFSIPIIQKNRKTLDTFFKTYGAEIF